MTPPIGREWKYVRRHYVLRITLLRVNKEYFNPNAQFDLIQKLGYERKGFVYEKKSFDGEEIQRYHTGLACLHHLAEYIDGFNQNNFEKIPDRWKCNKIAQNTKIT